MFAELRYVVVFGQSTRLRKMRRRGRAGFTGGGEAAGCSGLWKGGRGRRYTTSVLVSMLLCRASHSPWKLVLEPERAGAGGMKASPQHQVNRGVS